MQPRCAALFLLLASLATCTIDNPRLCQGRPCPDLSGPGGPDLGDLAAPADLAASMGSDGGACNRDDRCGPGCVDCRLGGAPFCSADGTRCVVCRKDADCGAGNFCQGERCQLCDRHDHCGPQCGVCTGSAHPSCSPGLRCTCVMPSDCGSSTADRCEGGVCTRACLSAGDCASAPAGKACLGLTERRCGCNGAADCAQGSTCQGGACVCGATVCPQDRRCVSGACQ